MRNLVGFARAMGAVGLAIAAAALALPRSPIAQPVTIAGGVTSVAANTPTVSDPTIYLASTPFCPEEAANGAFITRWNIGGIQPRSLVAVNPARAPGTCNPYQLLSNVHVDEDAIYFVDNQGPGGAFVLSRKLRTANAADPPTVLWNFGSNLFAAELITYTSSLFVIVQRVGQNDEMWQLDKLTGAIRNLNVTSGAPFQLSRMQVDSRYLFWLNAGTLWRNDLTNGNQVQIATGVTSYYDEGYSEECSPLGCTQLSRVLYGKQHQILNRYDLDAPFPVYTSPNTSATIQSITRDGTRYYFFERRPVPGGGFDREDLLYRLPVGDTTPSLLYGPIDNGGPGFDSLHTDLTFVYFRNRATREVQRLPNDAASLPVYAFRPTGIEITQGIQGPSNPVFLLQGRRTFVRFHVKTDAAIGTTDALLTGFDANTQQLLGTLRPSNPGGRIVVRSSPQRMALDDSFFFELPIEWTRRSRLSFAAVVNPSSVLFENDYSNNVLATGAYELAPPTRLPLHVVSWWYNFNGSFVRGGPLEDWNSLRWIERVYPLPSSGGPIGAPGDGLRTESTVIVDDALAARVNRTGADCDALLTPATATAPAVDDRNLCAATYVLGRIRAMRAAGDLPRGRYYYGSIAGQSGVTQFTRGFAPGSDTISMGPSLDPSAEQNYMAHEVGHTLGRGHPDSGGGGVCPGQNPSDPTYPHPRARIGASITPAGDETAVAGFDFGDSRFATPVVKGSSTHGDIMSYCSPYWISDHNYVGIYDYLSTVTPSAALAARSAAPAAASIPGDWLIANGTLSLRAEEAVFTTVQRRDSVTDETPPATGSWRLELRNASGVLLAAHPFTPQPSEDVPSLASFSFVVPFAAGTRELRLVEIASGAVAGSTAISAAPPVISDVALVGAPDPVTGTVTAAWTASDPDGDALQFDVLLTRDDGVSFEPVALSVADPTVDLDTAAWGGGPARLRVVASDGAQTAIADGAPFTVGEKAPIVRIASPAPDTAFEWGQTVNFTATVEDPQDAELLDADVEWSNAYRALGTGLSLGVTDLEVGVNVVTVTATNAAGLSGEATVTVLVGDDLTLPGPRVSTLPATIDFSVSGGETEIQGAALEVVNAGGGVLPYVASSSATWLTLDATSSTTGTAPQTITVAIDPSGLPDASVSTAEILVYNALDLDELVSVPVTVAKGDVVGGSPFEDSDEDGVDDRADNCPLVANADQADADADAMGDACETECTNGIDDDGDGEIDADDRGCADDSDASEREARFACDDGLDNDGDGQTDYPADPGCPFAWASPENPQCDDGLDNNGDGQFDFNDPNCSAHWPYWESAPCGIGAELALLLPLLGWIGGRSRRARR